MICVLFALCLFAGGVVNALYSAEDHHLSPDICTFGTINDEDENICTKILQIRILEGVSAVSSLSSFMLLARHVSIMLELFWEHWIVKIFEIYYRTTGHFK